MKSVAYDNSQLYPAILHTMLKYLTAECRKKTKQAIVFYFFIIFLFYYLCIYFFGYED